MSFLNHSKIDDLYDFSSCKGRGRKKRRNVLRLGSPVSILTSHARSLRVVLARRKYSYVRRSDIVYESENYSMQWEKERGKKTKRTPDAIWIKIRKLRADSNANRFRWGNYCSFEFSFLGRSSSRQFFNQSKEKVGTLLPTYIWSFSNKRIDSTGW